jgi:hypothetical protein
MISLLAPSSPPPYPVLLLTRSASQAPSSSSSSTSVDRILPEPTSVHSISSGCLHSDIDHLSAMSPPNTASPARSTTPITPSLILSGYFQSDIKELDDIFSAILSPSSSCQPSEPPQPEVALIDLSCIASSQLSKTNATVGPYL